MSRFLSIGGTKEDGTAKALKVNDSGELQLEGVSEIVLVENATLNRGITRTHNFTINVDYRVDIRITSGIESSWRVGVKSQGAPESNELIILESDGNKVLSRGNGSRSSAYSDVLAPISKNETLVVYHTSESAVESITYSVYLVKMVGSSARDYRKPKSLIVQDFGQLSASERKTVSGPLANRTVIDHLEFSTNSPKGHIEIRPFDTKKGAARNFMQVSTDGSSLTHVISPENIINGNSSLWDINSYEDGKYKFTLKKELILERYSFIVIENTTAEPINMAIFALLREV